MCKYSYFRYKCPHERLKDSDYCIFHLQDDKKEVDEFNKGINEILETEEDLIYFNGFYFPPGTSDFSKQNFQKKANFSDATFSGDANFTATYHPIDVPEVIAVGSGATFSEDAYFSNATFSKKTDFQDAELIGKFVLIPHKSETIDFTNTYFSDNVRIKTDMSKCSFANSNIERVDMTDSIWIRNKVGLSETPLIIWEEYQSGLSSNWKELEGIYRRLKQSYQKYGDNSTAGIFYYQEMECKRKQLKLIRKFVWYFFYKKLCGYGEKPLNVISASLFLIILFAFSFLFGGIEFVGSSILKVPPNVIDYNLSLNSFGIQWAMSNIDSVLKDFLLCLYTSVITFTTLGYGDVRPIGLSRIFASFEAGFGIIMTALFIFVFTRKMLR